MSNDQECYSWLLDRLSKDDVNVLEHVAMIYWSIWNQSNELCFSNTEDDPVRCFDRSLRLYHDFK